MKYQLLQHLKYIIRNYFTIGCILFSVALLSVHFLNPINFGGDGLARFNFMNTLVHQMKIIPMAYSSIGPLFSLPLWLISSFFNDPAIIVGRYNFIIFLIFLIVLYFWLKKIFDRKFILTFLIILSFGSMFPGHLEQYYGEVFSTICLTLGTLGLVLKKKSLGFIPLILAVMNTPALIIAFILVVLYQTWETRRLRYLFIVPLFIILVFTESTIRTGSLFYGFTTYILQDGGFKTILPFSGLIGFSYPFFLGILSILFSFGKGLIFFSPGIMLTGWAMKVTSNPIERKLIILWTLICLGLILVYAPWWAWYGGWFWGPRFFLFTSVPASWILAKFIYSKQKSRIFSIVIPIFVTLSVWVGIDGSIFQQNSLEICINNNFALEHLCWYVPEYSVLIRPFVSHPVLDIRSKIIIFIYGVIWLYIMIPLMVNLFNQIKSSIKPYRYLMKLSSWKI